MISEFWSWLWIVAGLYLLFEVWRGWRRGVVRHGVSVVALIVAGGVGWGFAWMTGFLADWITPFPPPVGRIIFGVIAALLFYMIAVILSSILFKKTSQQPPGLTRLIYGMGGAGFGLIFGLIVLLGMVSLVRTLEAIEEGKTTSAPQAVKTAEPQNNGMLTKLMNTVDPIPPEVYGIMTKTMQVMGSPTAMERLMQSESMTKLLSQPKVVALFSDPKLTASIGQGNYFALLASPKLMEAANDPDVQKVFTEFDFEKALDYALQTPPTSPNP